MQLRNRKGIPQDLLEGEQGGPRLPGEGDSKGEGALRGESEKDQESGSDDLVKTTEK